MSGNTHKGRLTSSTKEYPRKEYNKGRTEEIQTQFGWILTHPNGTEHTSKETKEFRFREKSNEDEEDKRGGIITEQVCKHIGSLRSAVLEGISIGM